MTILVTGSTGTIGSQLLASLAGMGIEARALTRSPERARLPQGVTPVAGSLDDLDSVRRALEGTSTLFLLAPNVADELTQALLTVNAARDAGVRGVVYLSVFRGERALEVPHFIAKHTVERMIEAFDLPATILRPAYFMQNDQNQKEALLAGFYGMPVGNRGVSMVDTRDIAEAAAIELRRRETASGPLPRAAYELVGPEALTGEDLAHAWSEALGRSVRYGGDDLDQLEERLRAQVPPWLAYEMRLMTAFYQRDGSVATPAELSALTALLGRPPRSYHDFARKMAAEWARG